MQKVAHQYKTYFTDKKYLFYFFSAVVFFAIAMIINSYAVIYATESASGSVKDIILSNIPVVDLDGISVYGPILVWIFVGIICLKDPKKIPFVLKSIALFVLIRSVFVSLTHIGPFPDQIATLTSAPLFLQKLTFGGDLFFSGHTGLPFLMSFILGKNIRVRILFIALALFFGIIVLLAHIHYSIDVLSAFFITYTIYKLSLIFFKGDKRIFDGDVGKKITETDLL